jgi:hypothetical protein
MQSQEFLEFEFFAKSTQNTNPAIRKEAEHSLSRYRGESFLPLLKQILEQSTDPIALFQSSALICSLITQPHVDRKEWIFYLLEQVKTKELAFHVRNSILQTVAICLKLQFNSKEITELLINLMAQNTRVGQLLLDALLDEFESKVQSRSGLSIEFHQSAKLDFQNNSLAQVLKLILDQLHALLEQTDASVDKMHSLARMVSCSEKVLSWDFITNASLIQNNRNDKRGLNLNQNFNVLLHPQVLKLFFDLVKHYQNSVYPIKLSTCLIQLASLNGQVFNSMQQRYEYLTNYFVLFEIHIKNIHVDDQFANEKIYECSQIGKNLLKAPVDVLQAIPNFCLVLKLLADLTKICIKLDDYDECLDEYLIMWSLFTEVVQQSTDNRQKPGFVEMIEMLNYVSLEVVNVYVESKITIREEDDDDDYGKDVEVYEDQLLNIATLARLKPDQTLRKLLAILNEKYSQLGFYFQQPTGNDGGIMECMHWLVLISGFILCDSAYGETPLIPESILEASNNSQGEDLVVLLSTKVFEIIGGLTFAKESIQVTGVLT